MSSNKVNPFFSDYPLVNYASRIGDLELRNNVIDHQKIVNDFIEKREHYLAAGNSEQIHVDEYGTIIYYKNNKIHRLNGPAIQYADGRKSWYVNGQKKYF